MPFALTIDAMALPLSTVTSTLAMVRAAERRGVDAQPVLARHGVTMATLLDPDNHLPVSTEFAIWDELRAETREPALQLVAPIELPVGTYHVLDYLVGVSATVGDGMRRIARFLGIIARQVEVSAQVADDECRLVATTASGGAVPPMYVDYTFGAVVGRMRAIAPDAFAVERVQLRQPPPASPAAYRDVFLCPVDFGAGADALVFSRARWDTRLPAHDPTLAQVLETHARFRLERMAAAPVALAGDVRAAIIAALPDGAPVDAVARALRLSVRTLLRRLDDAGTTYRDALDTVRGELAREYLHDGRVAISEVALLLGFADQRSFHRAFERWTGETPGRWRARVRGSLP